jgi:LDH2 family malate/lactate/ureidoglycolate dehydrogenase
VIPVTDQDIVVEAAALTCVVQQIFERCGMSDVDARTMAESLVESDLGGVNSHGVLRVPEYVHKLRGGGVNPRGRPRIVRDEGACLVVDGDNSMGQIGASTAMAAAIARAESLGIGAVAIRGSNHCGSMAYFTSQALRRDMIGVATTNALPTMAPWGGAERLIGINPLSIAIPAGAERPIVFDGAFSGAAHGKIRVYQQKGLPIPAGWATDRDGVATIDPAVAIDGLLLPIGGFKGAALAMIMGLMASMLSGGAYGTELGDMERGPTAGQDAHFVIAMRVGAFETVDRFKARVDAAIREIHESRRAPGVDRLYVPGEIEQLNRERSLRDGIPLNAVTVAALRRTAHEIGLPETI